MRVAEAGKHTVTLSDKTLADSVTVCINAHNIMNICFMYFASLTNLSERPI